MIVNDFTTPQSEYKTLSSFISDYTTSNKLFIPNSFQREYSWSSKEIETLLDDLYELYISNNEKDSLYIGRLVLSKREYYTKYIVDGQQRLTTLFLILYALSVKSENEIYLKKLHYNQDLDNYKLIQYVSDTHNNYLKTIGVDNPHVNPLNIGYKIIHEFLFGEKPRYPELNIDAFINSITNRTTFDVQVIPEECEKDYFMDINGKGVKLTETDILKAHFRNKVIEPLVFDIKWGVLLQEVRPLTPEMFKRSHGKTVFDIITGWVLELNGFSDTFNMDSSKIMKFLDDFIDLTIFTKNIMLEDGLYHHAYKIISGYSAYSCIPWVFKLSKRKGIDFAIKQFTLCLTSSVEPSDKIRRSFRSLSESDTLIKFDDYFNSASEITYKKPAKVKGFLSLIESILLFKKNGSDIKHSFTKNLSLFSVTSPRLKFTIEHIVSQSTEAPFVDRLGNLTILTKSENSEVQNNSKFLCYSETNIEITKQLCKGFKTDVFQQYNRHELENFGAHDIDKREVVMIKMAYIHIINHL